jgi:hypothetical protein
MVPIITLWLPILLSAVLVFLASSIMHVALTYHQSDCKQLPEEEKVMSALRSGGVKQGYYMFPYCNHKQMKSPEMMEKFKQGPIGMVVIRPGGMPAMGKYLGMWFAFCLLVSVFVAYLTGSAVPAGGPYLVVFRVAGTAAFLAYGLGHLSNGIWKAHPWAMTLKEVIDGLIYGVLTAVIFGWLWPR